MKRSARRVGLQDSQDNGVAAVISEQAVRAITGWTVETGSGGELSFVGLT
jgi:hypothetical protein